MKTGVIFGFVAFLLWGFFPIYWKMVDVIPAKEIVGHRIFWSFLFLAALLIFTKNLRWIKRALQNPKTIKTYLVSAMLLSINWFTFVYAVNNGYLVEASLGYFINPLMSVLFGVLLLKETIRLWQWIAIGLAGTGVLYLTLNYGQFPWLALVLATTFGLYGLLRKTGSLNSLQGLSLEMSLLFLPALFFILFLETKDIASFGHIPLRLNLILSLAGVVTATPLLLFAFAARRIKLSTVGFLQYITPTLHFLLGVFLYHEELSRDRLIGFCFIWIALAIYSADSVLVLNKMKLQKQSFSKNERNPV